MATKYLITDTLAMPECAVRIPRLGLGTWLSSRRQCVASCHAALKCGYRHIDTAQYYENEAEVGEAVRTSGLSRSDVFIATKIFSAAGTWQKSYQRCIGSVEKIDGEDGYVDLFLVHTASGTKEKRKEMWLALEKLYEQGKAKAIGVSNFGIGHIEEMKDYAKVWPPHVNQIEVSFWLDSTGLFVAQRWG